MFFPSSSAHLHHLDRRRPLQHLKLPQHGGFELIQVARRVQVFHLGRLLLIRRALVKGVQGKEPAVRGREIKRETSDLMC